MLLKFTEFLDFLKESETYVEFDKTKHHWITLHNENNIPVKVFIDDDGNILGGYPEFVGMNVSNLKSIDLSQKEFFEIVDSFGLKRETIKGWDAKISPSKKSFIFLVDDNVNRAKKMKEIFDTLEKRFSKSVNVPDSFIKLFTKENSTNVSSAGRVQIGKFKFEIKYKNKQGNKSAGMQNEEEFISTINNLCSKDTPRTLKFNDGTKQHELKNVVKCLSCGKDVAGGKKADAILVCLDEDGKEKEIRVSLKQNNTERFSYSDYTETEEFNDIVQNMKKAGFFTKNDIGLFTLKDGQEIAIRLPQKYINGAVFGSDIDTSNGGCVIRGDMWSQMANPIGNATMEANLDDKTSKLVDTHIELKCDEIITDTDELKDSVYILFRHSTDRRNKKLDLPGIRIEAITTKTRAGNNRIKRAVILSPKSDGTFDKN